MSVIEAVRRAPSPARGRGLSVGREVAVHIAYFLIGLIVPSGAMLGSLSPFGASFAAAVPFTYMPAGLLGAGLSYLLFAEVDAFRYIAVLIAIGAVRWVLGEFRKLSRSRLFPAAVAFIPVLATGVALTFSSRSEVTETFRCLVEALIAAAGAYFMSRTAALAGSRRALGGFNQQELACLSMTACILLLSLGGLHIGALSAGRTIAVLSVLLFARYGLVKGGSIAGIATGVVFSLADSDRMFLSAGYALTGLMGGLLAPMGKAAVAFVALICNTMTAFASPDDGMVLSVLLETLVAGGIFLLIPKEAGRWVTSIFSDEAAQLTQDAVRRNVTMRLSHCSRALANVSSCVNAVSEKLTRLYEPGMERVYERVCEDTCKSCGLRVYCWEKQRDLTADDMARMGEILCERGYVKEQDVEDRFMKRCCKSSEVARSLSRAYQEHLSLEAARRRVGQVRSVVAGQFAGLSEILEDLAEEIEEIDSFDADAAEKVIAALNSIGLMVVDCSCRRRIGRGMNVEIELAVGKKTALSASVLSREVSRACARRFESPSISFEGERARVTMSELPLYDLEIGSAQHVCDDGALCGDCLNYFNNGEGSTVAILSDGMGSGGRAAVDANMAVSLMTRLCKAGLSYDCSLKVVNASLMIKSEEESLATLDLIDFNRFTGKLTLMKAGACTTYVRRSSKLTAKDIPSLPLGILNEARFIKEDVTLSKDDMIVMISDGAMIGSCEWIEKLILSWHKGSAEDLAARIVEDARRRRLNDRDDDISAVVLRVTENA